MARKRRPEISALNVLFCLVVIFIHIVSYAVSSFDANTFKYNMAMIPWRLSSFVVQGFIMLSGVKLFMNKKDELPFSKYFKSRLKGVILPYAVCFAVYYLSFIIKFDYPSDPGFIVKSFLSGNVACHFYFIVILVQFDLLFPLWKKTVNNCSPVVVLPFALLFSSLMEMCFPQILNTAFPSVSFIYNDRLFTTYLSYWLIGCYIGKNYDAFLNILKKNFRTICTIFAFVLVLVIFFSYIAFNHVASVPYLNHIHNMYIIYMCIFLYALAIRIPQQLFKKIPLIQQIDKASFYIYLYHILVLMFANTLLDKVGICAQGLAFAVRCAVVYILTPLCCILYLKFKNRIFKSKIKYDKTVTQDAVITEQPSEEQITEHQASNTH